MAASLQVLLALLETTYSTKEAETDGPRANSEIATAIKYNQSEKQTSNHIFSETETKCSNLRIHVREAKTTEITESVGKPLMRGGSSVQRAQGWQISKLQNLYIYL